VSTESWTSRKFVLAVLVFFTATCFVVFNKANFQDWSNIVQWILVTYLGANVGEHAVERMGKK